jgi:hypothetical protein
MTEIVNALPTLDRIGTVGTFVFVAILVITRRLVWHTDLKEVKDDRDRWQQLALDALTGPAQAGVRAAEVAVGVVSSLPDPQAERDSAGKG